MELSEAVLKSVQHYEEHSYFFFEIAYDIHTHTQLIMRIKVHSPDIHVSTSACNPSL